MFQDISNIRTLYDTKKECAHKFYARIPTYNVFDFLHFKYMNIIRYKKEMRA